MMHWRDEAPSSPAPSRRARKERPARQKARQSERPVRPARPARQERPPRAKAGRPAPPLAIRFLGLAVAALMTANGVVLAEQAAGRDLFTLAHDGVSNAREAVARLLEGDERSPEVAGEVLDQTTTSTTAAPETTTSTQAPAPAAAAAAPETSTSTAPPATSPTTAPKKPAASKDVDWNHVVDTVRPYVEKETGLPFSGPVRVSVLDAAPFTGRLNAVRLDPAVARAQRAEGMLKAFGIVEPAVNLTDQVRRLSTGTVSVLYDPKGNELVIRSGQLTPFVLKTVVHELVRADYDQHFDLDRPNLANPDDETASAFNSLIEGTAGRIENRFISALPDKDKQAVQAEAQRLAGQLPKDLPDYVVVNYAFPFGSGPKFAEALITGGGAAKVNAAFGAPPTTTEQIIHPEKFIAGEGPKALTEPLAEGQVSQSGSLGQLMLSLMLAQVLDSGDAETAADGWGGDRWVSWRNGAQTCARLVVDMDNPDKVAGMGQALADWAQDTPGATITGAGPFTVTRCV